MRLSKFLSCRYCQACSCPKCKLGGALEMETNCGNDFAENGRKKKKKRIVATKLPKMEEKKRCYIHNIFYNKLQMVSCYWFKFEPNTKITFLPPIITISNNLLLRICCKNIVKMLWTYHNVPAYTQIILQDCVMEKKKIYIYIY